MTENVKNINVRASNPVSSAFKRNLEPHEWPDFDNQEIEKRLSDPNVFLAELNTHYINEKTYANAVHAALRIDAFAGISTALLDVKHGEYFIDAENPRNEYETLANVHPSFPDELLKPAVILGKLTEGPLDDSMQKYPAASDFREVYAPLDRIRRTFHRTLDFILEKKPDTVAELEGYEQSYKRHNTTTMQKILVSHGFPEFHHKLLLDWRAETSQELDNETIYNMAVSQDIQVFDVLNTLTAVAENRGVHQDGMVAFLLKNAASIGDVTKRKELRTHLLRGKTLEDFLRTVGIVDQQTENLNGGVFTPSARDLLSVNSEPGDCPLKYHYNPRNPEPIRETMAYCQETYGVDPGAILSKQGDEIRVNSATLNVTQAILAMESAKLIGGDSSGLNQTIEQHLYRTSEAE